MIRLLLLTLTMLFAFSTPAVANGNDAVLADTSWTDAAASLLQIDSADDGDSDFLDITAEAFPPQHPAFRASFQYLTSASGPHWRPQASRAPPAI